MDRSTPKRTLVAATLAGALLVSSCQGAREPSHESEDSTMDMEQTVDETTGMSAPVTDEIATDAVTEEVTTRDPETTAPETEAETPPSEPPMSEHDTLMQSLAYNEAERAILSETAKKMAGLRVTYYADAAATQAVRSDVAATATVEFKAGDGIQTAVFEGFITFPEDGAVTMTAPGAANQDCVSVIEGEHHVRAGNKIRVKAKAGAQYGIKLKLDRADPNTDQTISLL